MKSSKPIVRSRARRNGRQGSAIVESSLIFLAFFVMAVAALDFGQFLFIHQALVERARSCARWGAINDPANLNDVVNMVLYNQVASPATDLQLQRNEVPAGYLNLSPSNVAVTKEGAGTDNFRLKLVISGYSYTMISPYVTGTYTGPPVTVTVPLGIYN